MLLRLLKPLLISLLLFASAAHAQTTDPDATSASDLEVFKRLITAPLDSADAIGKRLEKTAATAAIANNLDELASLDPDDAMAAYQRAKSENLSRLDLASKFKLVGRVGTVFQGAEALNGLRTAARKASDGDWEGATEEGLKAALGVAQSLAVGAATGALIAVACGATAGLGCLLFTAAASTVALSALTDGPKEAAAKGISSYIFRRREEEASACLYRPDSRLCDYLPDDRARVRGGQGAALAQNADDDDSRDEQTASGSRPGAGSSSAAGGRSSGGGGRAPARTSYGSTRITARAGAVVTTARGGKSAVTDIGVSDGGSANLSVTTGTVVTKADGRSAETVVGRGNGVVSTGMVYNQGGSLIVGDNGKSTRDGKLCLRFYANLCIVQLYPRPPKKPCPPPPWMFDGVFCLRPADLKHQVLGKPF